MLQIRDNSKRIKKILSTTATLTTELDYFNENMSLKNASESSEDHKEKKEEMEKKVEKKKEEEKVEKVKEKKRKKKVTLV